MPSWSDVKQAAPEFAERVRQVFQAGTNKTLATLRSDGSPRISASELQFADGEVQLGMMGGSRKLADVRRDPRVALHSPTLEPPPPDASPGWQGDAKLAGVLVEVPAPADTPHENAGFFRLDIREAVLTYLGDPPDHLVIESWHDGRGFRRQTRT
jgi:hypothetical protein